MAPRHGDDPLGDAEPMHAAGAAASASNRAADTMPFRTGLVLARIACANGATRAHLVRDFAPLFSHKLSPAELRKLVLGDVEMLLADQAIEDTRGRLTVAAAGVAQADAFLGRKGASGGAWSDVRDGRLIAMALGLDAVGPKKLKAILTPDGLRAFILQQAYALPQSGTQTTAKLRAQLAVVALERAFGNKIKTGLGAGSGFSAKAGRLLAGQLSSRPRDLGSDGRLVAALAAEAVDARQTDADALRAALLRRLADKALLEGLTVAKPRGAVTSPTEKPVAANDAGLPGAPLPPTRRPDPAGFSKEILKLAATCAEGWAGNRKAFVSRVWQKLAVTHPEWGLSEIEFKCMLGEAHRTGHLRLATADLKDKTSAAEIEASAITYKNTQWHLIRIVDAG